MGEDRREVTLVFPVVLWEEGEDTLTFFFSEEELLEPFADAFLGKPLRGCSADGTLFEGTMQVVQKKFLLGLIHRPRLRMDYRIDEDTNRRGWLRARLIERINEVAPESKKRLDKGSLSTLIPLAAVASLSGDEERQRKVFRKGWLTAP